MRHLCVSRRKTPDSSSLGSDYLSNTTDRSSFPYSCCIYAEQASLTVLCYSNSSHFSHNKQSIISHKHPLSRPFHKLPHLRELKAHINKAIIYFSLHRNCEQILHTGDRVVVWDTHLSAILSHVSLSPHHSPDVVIQSSGERESTNQCEIA